MPSDTVYLPYSRRPRGTERVGAAEIEYFIYPYFLEPPLVYTPPSSVRPCSLTRCSVTVFYSVTRPPRYFVCPASSGRGNASVRGAHVQAQDSYPSYFSLTDRLVPVSYF